MDGGTKGGKEIPWVSWDDVCKPERDGGLGVRNLRLANQALLSKWRWCIISEETGPWKDLLTTKYGYGRPLSMLGGRKEVFGKASSWWKDMSLLGTSSDSYFDWFSNSVMKFMGNCLDTSF